MWQDGQSTSKAWILDTDLEAHVGGSRHKVVGEVKEGESRELRAQICTRKSCESRDLS